MCLYICCAMIVDSHMTSQYDSDSFTVPSCDLNLARLTQP